MADPNKHSDLAWERFFEFVYPCEENLTRQEVQAELKSMGISVTKAVSRVRLALAGAKGRDLLAVARVQRPGVMARLKQVTGDVSDGLRERLRAIIAGSTQGEVQLAYFRKLESAATDDDLHSLFEDIRCLDVLSEDGASGKPPTK